MNVFDFFPRTADGFCGSVAGTHDGCDLLKMNEKPPFENENRGLGPTSGFTEGYRVRNRKIESQKQKLRYRLVI